MTSPTDRVVEPIPVRGDVDDGFGPVMDVFARNFRERGDLGAACSVYVAGQNRVDVWGGIADRRTGRQLGFADDEYGVGFAYLSNQMGGIVDQRANLLTAAVRTCLRDQL